MAWSWGNKWLGVGEVYGLFLLSKVVNNECNGNIMQSVTQS